MFGSNFISPESMANKDPFDLIGAANDYMDAEMDGEPLDAGYENKVFIHDNQEQQNPDFELPGQYHAVPRRSQAFNGHIEGIQPSSIHFEEEKFGEIGADGQIIDDFNPPYFDKQGQDFDSNIDQDQDELEDLVSDDFFNLKSGQEIGGRGKMPRHTSAFVGTSELMNDLEIFRNQTRDSNNLDQRIKMMVGEQEHESGGQRRGESFISRKRHALKLKKIKRDIEIEEMQNIVEDGSMAGMPRLHNSKPRTYKYDDIAISKVDMFLDQADQLTREQIEELELQKELLNYKKILEDEESMDVDEINQIDEAQCENKVFNNIDGDFPEGILQDFYMEMNHDNEFHNYQDSQKTQKKEQLLVTGHSPNNFQFENNYDFTKESTDMIRFIDWNERRYRSDALSQVKQSQVNNQGGLSSLQNLSAASCLPIVRQNRLTKGEVLKKITEKMLMERQFNNSRATCIAINEDLIFVGNSLGELWMYDKDTQEPFECFVEKSKEFYGNSITAIEIHPVRNEYVLIGYHFGQIVLLDVCDPGKSLKVIKDHHKGSTIVNLAFCDWPKTAKGSEPKFEEKKNELNNRTFSIDVQNPYELGNSQSEISKSKEGNMTEWMFISIDTDGKVLVNTIQKSMFLYKSSKQYLIEPKKGESRFFSVSTKFRSSTHQQPKLNDQVSLVSLGNQEKVCVFAITQHKHQLIKEIKRPLFKASNGQLTELQMGLGDPCLAWGYGTSPIFKDKIYATLVIGWGPLLQQFILNDVTDPAQIFFDDGYHVLQTEQTSMEESLTDQDKQTKEEVQVKIEAERRNIEALHLINPYEQDQKYEALSQTNNLKNQQKQTGMSVSPFEMPDLSIEKIFYQSESIILVFTRASEFRVFYTQKFEPGSYDPFAKRNPQILRGKQVPSPGSSFTNSFIQEQQAKQISYAQLDEGIWVSNLAQSEPRQTFNRNAQIFYQNTFNQTIKQFDGTIVALGTKGLQRFMHLRWDQSLEGFKELLKGQVSWIQEMKRSLDIYTGKVKGFYDVPEMQERRQEYMRGSLKIHVRGIVTDQLEKWAAQVYVPSEQHSQMSMQNLQSDNPYAITQNSLPNLDDTSSEILEDLNILNYQKTNEQLQKYKTLVRLSIEFCITIQDCYFLFYDLFLLFQEENLQEIFLGELKPFIMAGRFSDWQMPDDILQNHIINYYKDPQQPDLIEKIIINLNLKECPIQVITELIQFSKQNFLSTALLYLYMAVFNSDPEASCVHVILALLDLYRQAKTKNPGTLKEIRCIKDLSSDSIERLRAEKSQLYLGYKILWVIRLFLNGKNFPQGNIPQNQWRNFVFEIVDCITQEFIMLDLLYIDPEAYFQIVSILFYRGKVFDFIKEGKIQQDKVIKMQQSLVKNALISQDVYAETMIQLSHNQILERFEKVCQSRSEQNYVVPDEIRLQYLFFVANVASKSAIQKDGKFYFSCMKELLSQSSKFLNFNKSLLQRAMHRKNRSGQPIGDAASSAISENRYLVVSENALIELMDLCEPLEEAQTELLLQKTEYTRFNHLRVKLLEKKEDYVQCLQLLVDGFIRNYPVNKNKNEITVNIGMLEAIERVFSWIENILDLLAARKTVANPESTGKEDAFRRQILSSFKGLINIDATRTYVLIDEKFENEHEKFLESINGHLNEQYKYLEAVLNHDHQKIQSCINDFLMSGSEKDKALMFMKLQKMHLKLLCQIHPEDVLERIRRIKKNQVHFALDECLEICQEYKQVEACSILANKMANYISSVTEYMTLVSNKEYFSFLGLIKQLSRIAKHGQSIPHFNPYQDKEEKAKTKEMLKKFSTNIYAKDILSQAFSNNQHGLLEAESDIQQAHIKRFDYIVRKVVKICGKESTENFNEETIDKMWWFALDLIFKIKSQEIKILERLRDQKLTSIKELNQNVQKQINSGIEQPGQILNSINEKYSTHIKNLETFFRSRISYVIENILKYIELSQFLDHIVRHDENIRFSELEGMITSIFSEFSNEKEVLVKASRSARKQILQSFANEAMIFSHGILFRYRKCNICNKLLDEETKIYKKKVEIMSQARRGSFYSHALEVNSDSDEGNVAGQWRSGNLDDKMRLYECGHAFHIICIKNHINEIVQQSSQYQTSHSKVKPVVVTAKMHEEQMCPWCYSEKFNIDFDGIFQKQTRRVGVQPKVGVSNAAEVTRTEGNGLLCEGDIMDFEDNRAIQGQRVGLKIGTTSRGEELTGSMVQRQKKSATEQKMGQFDRLCVTESVNCSNFRVDH